MRDGNSRSSRDKEGDVRDGNALLVTVLEIGMPARRDDKRQDAQDGKTSLFAARKTKKPRLSR